MKKERDYFRDREITMIMAFITLIMGLLLVIALIICVPIINKSEKAKISKESATTIGLVAPATVYEPKVVGKNVYITVDGSSTASEFVNVRSNPNMSDKYRIGKVESGTSFIVNEYYSSDEFVGFPVSAISGIDLKADDDGIIWISGYYLHVGSFELPETVENPEGLVVLDVPKGYKKITIVNGNPNVRATPETKNVENVYGQLEEGTVLHPAKILTNDTYTFYGVSVEDVKDDLKVAGFGHIEADSDGIVWISASYSTLGY